MSIISYWYLAVSFFVFCFFLRGMIKVEDIFYYNAYKTKFTKGTKRKDYRDAVEEIETDIIEDGGDGSSQNESATAENTSVSLLFVFLQN